MTEVGVDIRICHEMLLCLQITHTPSSHAWNTLGLGEGCNPAPHLTQGSGCLGDGNPHHAVLMPHRLCGMVQK